MLNNFRHTVKLRWSKLMTLRQSDKFMYRLLVWSWMYIHLTTVSLIHLFGIIISAPSPTMTLLSMGVVIAFWFIVLIGATIFSFNFLFRFMIH